PLSVTPPAATQLTTLSLHDALPIYRAPISAAWRIWAGPECSSPTASNPTRRRGCRPKAPPRACSFWHPAPSVSLPPPCPTPAPRSEEHTSELQSRENLVCRLLLEKK